MHYCTRTRKGDHLSLCIKCKCTLLCLRNYWHHLWSASDCALKKTKKQLELKHPEEASGSTGNRALEGMNEVNMMYFDKCTVPGSSTRHCFQSYIGQRSHQITHRRTWFLSLAYVGSLIGSLYLPRPTVFLVQQAEQPRWFSLSNMHSNKVASSCRVFRQRVGLHLVNLQGSSTAHLSTQHWSMWQ